MSSQENKGIEQRESFYSKDEIRRYLMKNGVPKSRRALKTLIAVGIGGSPDAEVTEEQVDQLGDVKFEVHPQQINVRDGVSGDIIAVIEK